MLKLNDKGFTLIECILMLSIISIVLSFILLNNQVIGNLDKTKEIEGLLDEINIYRDKAMINKINIEFRVNMSANNYSFTELDKKRKLIFRKKIKKGYKLHWNNFDSHIVFRSSGVPSRGGKLILKDGKNEVNIIIQPVTGYLRIEKLIK